MSGGFHLVHDLPRIKKELTGLQRYGADKWYRIIFDPFKVFYHYHRDSPKLANEYIWTENIGVATNSDGHWCGDVPWWCVSLVMNEPLHLV